MPAGCWVSGEGHNAIASIQRIDEDALTAAIIALASKLGRCGYRLIATLLQRDGCQVGKDLQGLQSPHTSRALP
jgi:hypothetical protein